MSDNFSKEIERHALPDEMLDEVSGGIRGTVAERADEVQFVYGETDKATTYLDKQTVDILERRVCRLREEMYIDEYYIRYPDGEEMWVPRIFLSYEADKHLNKDGTPIV